jgi:3-oxoacyl-[acyl-carrier-protein] synthase-1
LQIHHNFIFPNINCEDVNEQITSLISEDKIPRNLIEKEVNIVAKASFGFGDVNGCLIFKKFQQ